MIEIDRIQTAIHEAAHVVVGHLVGEIHHRVVVFEAGRGATSSYPAVDQDPQDRIVVLLAGELAELAFGFELSPTSDHMDQKRARGLALKVAKWPGSGSIATADWIMQHAERRAEQLVADNLRAIRTVADVLEANGGRLGGDEVAAAIAKAFAGPVMARSAANVRPATARDVRRGNASPTDRSVAAALARLRLVGADWRGRLSYHPLNPVGRVPGPGSRSRIGSSIIAGRYQRETTQP